MSCPYSVGERIPGTGDPRVLQLNENRAGPLFQIGTNAPAVSSLNSEFALEWLVSNRDEGQKDSTDEAQDSKPPFLFW